jgi:hypothetical protein
MACFAIPLSYPPIGCGGIEIHGLEMERLSGITRYNNGIVETKGLFRLVGTWDGKALMLTRQPVAASFEEATAVPRCAQPHGAAEPDRGDAEHQRR